jgi:hypothetical protein
VQGPEFGPQHWKGKKKAKKSRKRQLERKAGGMRKLAHAVSTNNDRKPNPAEKRLRALCPLLALVGIGTGLGNNQGS